MTGSSNFSHLSNQLSPLDMSVIDNAPYLTSSYDFFGNSLSDHDPPLYSAGLSAASVDWSNYEGLEFSKATDFAPSSYSQPQSLGGFEFNGSEQPPTLTTATSTSGDASEIDEFFPGSFDDVDTERALRLGDTNSGLDIVQLQATLLATSDLSTLNYDQFKLMKAGTKFLPTPASLAGDEPMLTMHNAGRSLTSHRMDDDSTGLWLSDYTHGLPPLPVFADSPEPGMSGFWE
jgi:hypothetical protein